MPGPVRRVAYGCAIGFCLYAAWASARLAEAGRRAHRGDAAGLQAAARLAPDNPDYQLRLSEWSEAVGEDPLPALRRSTALSPYNAEAWIRIGLHAEISGRMDAAEPALLEAARVSRLYEPRWTLANFYFRRGNQAQFWRWAAAALAISHSPSDALFQLCQNLEPDPAVVLARIVPDREAVVDRYLRFLVSTGPAVAALPVARRLLRYPGPDKAPALLLSIDKLVDAGVQAPAVELWNALCRQGLAPGPVLDPKHGVVLGNPGFDSPPRGQGFDWRIVPVRGVDTGYAPGELRFTFSGREPEAGEVLTHPLPVVRGVPYQLQFEYCTRDIPFGSGLQWRLTGRKLGLPSPPLFSEAWATATVSFTAPEDGICTLALRYSRPPGYTRLAGTVRLRKVRLGRAS